MGIIMQNVNDGRRTFDSLTRLALADARRKLTDEVNKSLTDRITQEPEIAEINENLKLDFKEIREKMKEMNEKNNGKKSRK